MLILDNIKIIYSVKTSKLSRNQFCTSMVQNPIYESDGPVYDSVQPQFNSRVTASNNACIDLKHQGLEISTAVWMDKNRYVDQPGTIHSCSFSFSSNDLTFEDSTKIGMTLPSKLISILI